MTAYESNYILSNNIEFEEKITSFIESTNTDLPDSFLNLTKTELSEQITKCLKLSAENRISYKNAFQIQLIDLLFHALGKEEPKYLSMSLQLASACLNASTQIYAHRVDSVHSDLLKVVSHSRGAKRDFEDLNVQCAEYDYQPKRKKRKNQQFILSSNDSLKGRPEMYNPLSLINCSVDTLTTDALHQVSLPQHANSGTALNLYNDVLLDKISQSTDKDPESSISSIHKLRFCSDFQMCPSFSTFRFLHWSVDSELENTLNYESDYHFNLDSPVDEGYEEGDTTLYSDERSDACLSISAEDLEKIRNTVDFEDSISSNPNADVEYEYSYLQPKHYNKWNGLAHWKVVFRKKNKVKSKVNGSSILPGATFQGTCNKTFDPSVLKWEHYCIYFKKPTVLLHRLQLPIKESENETLLDESLKSNNQLNLSTLDNLYQNCSQDSGHFEMSQDHPIDDSDDSMQLTTNNAETFLGDSLVPAPKLTSSVVVPYSLTAKKINMKKLKEKMWGILTPKNKSSPTILSEIYSKMNAAALSPGLAFASLLHLSHEKNLKIEEQQDLSDLSIKICSSKN